jgi:hypothetical protein
MSDQEFTKYIILFLTKAFNVENQYGQGQQEANASDVVTALGLDPTAADAFFTKLKTAMGGDFSVFADLSTKVKTSATYTGGPACPRSMDTFTALAKAYVASLPPAALAQVEVKPAPEDAVHV